MKTRQLFVSLTLGLGLVMALFWLLGTGSVLALNFNVTKFTDGNDGSCDPGDCSLREAIRSANVTPGPDTITLPAGTHTLTITGAYEDNNATGDLDITETLTITGAGPEVTIIDASGLSDRVLHVLTGPVVISGVTIRNGSGIDRGGGIFNEAALTLINSTVFSNSASDGGGIFNDGGVMTLTHSTVISNIADESGGGIKNGDGGIVELINSTIRGNRATTVDGGGIDNYRGGTVELTNSTIISNTADRDGGGINTWENSTVELTNSTVSSNTASYGGGLLLCSKDAVLTNIIVADNQANTAGSGLYIEASSPRLLHTTIARNSGGDGSGVHVAVSATVAMTNTIVATHTVGITVTAGSTVTLESTLWHGNTTNWDGVGTINYSNDHTGDPDFVDPDAGDYHIGPNSAAIDAGVNAGVDDDIDGESRPNRTGYDLGADEFWCKIYLPIILKSH